MANPWVAFTYLINRKNKSIVKIISINTNSNNITVEIPNTATRYVVNGPTDGYAVNDYVFVEDKKITGKAPVLREVVTEEIS